MNVVNLVGRLSALSHRERNEETRHTKLRVTVPRRPTAFAHPTAADASDHVSCIAYGKLSDSLERSGEEGRLVAITGRLRVEEMDLEMPYTTVIADSIYYLSESKERA